MPWFNHFKSEGTYLQVPQLMSKDSLQRKTNTAP